MSTKPLLQVCDVRTYIGSPRGVIRAVDGVSLTLPAGEALGIVGESGSGKSVLARTVMGISHPGAASSGEVLFDGRDVLSMSLAERREVWGKRIAMVFQDPGRSLNPVVKVERQLTEGMIHHLGISKSEAKSRALALLKEVGVPDPERRLSNYPHEMSGGMRQRIMIATALACEPDLLIADEPTTALDVTVQRQILDLLRRIQRERNMATMLISHDLAVVAGRTDSVAIMYAGRLAEMGATRAVFNAPRHRYTHALFAATPTVDHERHAPLPLILGALPDPMMPPPGCRFAPRCEAATNACREGHPPPMETPTAGHHVACLHQVSKSASEQLGGVADGR
jgi:peptide/nickel transport system ATP-binding protein